MKLRIWVSVVTGLVIVMFQTSHTEAQESPLPRFAQAPLSVPYRPDRSSKSGTPEVCPTDFAAQPETGVIYKVGAGIIPPKVTQYVTVQLTKQGQEAYKHDLFKDPNEVLSRISVVVDTKGKPTALCLQTAAGFDLDELAANAVLQYPFKPAQKDGKNVAMRMTIEVRYETH